VRYPEPQPYANLLLSLLHRLGFDMPQFGSSTGPLAGLDRPLGASPGVIDDGTWQVVSRTDKELTARGLLEASDRIEEASIYYLRLSGGSRIRVQARFGNLDDLRFDEYRGRVVTVVGTYTATDGDMVIRVVKSVQP
jgi:hypothetical protein